METRDDSGVERTSLESDLLASVGYDEDVSSLEVEFRNGSVYRYFAVPQSVFYGLMSAPSKGTFFLERIKSVYGFKRMS